MEEFGISFKKNYSLISVKSLVQFGLGAVKRQDPDVWQPGQDLVNFLFKADQKTDRRVMHEDNSNIFNNVGYI